MSEAKHTPGPWTFSRWNEFGDMRFYIAQADGAPHTPQHSDVATLIAETTSNEWQSIQEANARLIAVAPEMLELLTRYTHMDETAADTDNNLYRSAKALLAKATEAQ